MHTTNLSDTLFGATTGSVDTFAWSRNVQLTEIKTKVKTLFLS